jgi:hypothetical protein
MQQDPVSDKTSTSANESSKEEHIIGIHTGEYPDPNRVSNVSESLCHGQLLSEHPDWDFDKPLPPCTWGYNGPHECDWYGGNPTGFMKW